MLSLRSLLFPDVAAKDRMAVNVDAISEVADRSYRSKFVQTLQLKLMYEIPFPHQSSEHYLTLSSRYTLYDGHGSSRGERIQAVVSRNPPMPALQMAVHTDNAGF